jgi:hypothetical protein
MGEQLAVDFLRLVSTLRNSVHAVELGSTRVLAHPSHTRVLLPRSDATKLLEILTRHRWNETWGLEEWGDVGFFVRPDALVEHLVGTALPLLNRIIDATPIEALGGAHRHSGWEPYSERHWPALRWQLGLRSERPG